MPFFSPFGGDVAPGSSSSGPTFSQSIGNIGGAVGDIFGGFADIEKMKGLEAEQQQYELAASYAGQEAQLL